MPGGLRVRQFVHGHVVGLALLEAGNRFPAYDGDNNSDTDAEL
jgi:hypothetical protein